MSRLSKAEEKKQVKRKYYTDKEMKEFNDLISPYLEDSLYDSPSKKYFPIKRQMDFFRDQKILKVSLREGKAGLVDSDFEYSIYENRVNDYFEVNAKLNQWSYWVRGIKYTQSLDESIALEKRETEVIF